LPVAFLEHLRPFLPWALVATGGAGRVPVMTFLPQAHGAAAAWIVKAQRSKRNVCVVMGELLGPVTGTTLVRGHLRGSRHFGVKLARAKAAALNAFRPAPFLRMEAGDTILAAWRLFNEIPLDAVERIAKDVAAQLGGVTLGHLLPVAGTTYNGARVKLIHMFKDRLPVLTDFMRGASATVEPLTARANTIKAQSIEWMWPGLFAFGALGLLGGAAGVGKTQAALGIAAIVSRGGTWPTGEQATAGNVLVFETEDDAASVVIPRLLAAGADMDRIAVGSASFDLSGGIGALAAEAKRLGNVRLIVLSPFRRFLGNSENVGTLAVRDALAPLLTWATENRVAILGIAHPLKGKEHLPGFAGDPALVEVARAAWSIIPDPADRNPILKHRARVMVAAKANLAPDGLTLRYKIEGADVGGIATSRIVWQSGDNAASAPHGDERQERAMQRAKRAAPASSARAGRVDASEWLRIALASGPRLATELKRDAMAAGIGKGTLYRAGENIGVTIEGDGNFRVCTWKL